MAQCITDHQYVDWTRHGTVAGGREFLLHRVRCAACGAEVSYTETPSDIERRKKVESDGRKQGH